MLRANHLTKNYGDLTALDDLDVELARGRIGLLGPNGAGKTTFLKLVMGLLQPSAGEAYVLGYEVGPESLELRRHVGYMPEHECLPPDYSGIDFVSMMGRLSGMNKGEALQRTHEVFGYLNMREERYRPIREYSGGMKQKVKLAQAMVHAPRLILADEPTSGLDPMAREEMLMALKSLGQVEDLNIILSTHILSDVEQLCDRVMLIDRGRLMVHTTVEEVLSRYAGAVAVHTDAPEKLTRALTAKGYTVRGRGEELSVEGREEEVMEVVISAAAEIGAGIRHMTKSNLKLEDLYLDHVGYPRQGGADNG